MKKIIICLAIAGSSLISSGCSDWLDVLPKNEQVSPDYWKTKEEVEEVLGQGYAYMRSTVSNLIYMGEVRASSVYAYSGSEIQKLQNFQLTASSSSCKWGVFYNVLNIANSIIKYAPEVKEEDETYTEAAMNSHMAEAYFMRAWTYFTLVRNYKEVPLILEPYVTDAYPFQVAKESEEVVISQVKEDIRTALASGAAKEFYDDDEWSGASKGRITKWALYALMADVCLWSEDYAGCVEYADLLINATSGHRPAFMTDAEQWFSIFNPGNSNESIFEINFDVVAYPNQDNSPSPSNYFKDSNTSQYQYSPQMCAQLYNETVTSGEKSVRAEYGAYKDLEDAATSLHTLFAVWKYQGYAYLEQGKRDNQDANWILYRMADILLMKAEALIWQGGSANYQTAMDLINRIRTRANAVTYQVSVEEETEESMLKYLLEERNLELAAEGKRWYDLLRFGRTKNFKYKESFIEFITTYNSSANAKWLRSVLKNTNAWYLPIPQSDIDRNPLLKQNPYYDITSN